jgi:hypothetical protein
VEQAIQYISGRYQLDPAALSAGTFRLDGHGQWPVPIAADLPDFPPQAESCITQVHQTGTNQLYQVAFSPRGLLVAFAELPFDDSACARLDRRLCEQWATLQADDQLKVAIWLTPIDHERLYDLIAARYQSTVDPWAADPHRLAEEVEFLAGQAYQARAAPLLLFLEESGVEDADVHRSAPVVTTTLSGTILRTLAEWPDVVRIEFVPEGE